MSDADIERIARRLCAIRGVNPDLTICHGAPPSSAGTAPAIALYSPRWKVVEGPEEREAISNAKDGDVVPVKRL